MSMFKILVFLYLREIIIGTKLPSHIIMCALVAVGFSLRAGADHQFAAQVDQTELSVYKKSFCWVVPSINSNYFFWYASSGSVASVRGRFSSSQTCPPASGSLAALFSAVKDQCRETARTRIMTEPVTTTLAPVKYKGGIHSTWHSRWFRSQEIRAEVKRKTLIYYKPHPLFWLRCQAKGLGRPF